MAKTLNETQPLLAGDGDEPLVRSLSKDDLYDSQLAGFDPEGDPENPIDWPKNYKRGIVALLAFMAFATYVTIVCLL